MTGLVGKNAKYPKAESIIELAEKRPIVCDECGIGKHMNYNVIKR